MMRKTVLLGAAVSIVISGLFPHVANAQAGYTLKATPKTVAWGYYDANATPVLRVKSGDPSGIQASSTPATTQEQKPTLIYVRHLVPPRSYPPIARGARLSGTVVIKLTVGPDGSVLSTESTLGDKDTKGFPILRDDAENLVKKWTFGCVGCSPRTPFEHTIKFNYRLDTEDLLPDNLVIMNLPDEVTIYSSPLPCDHCPSPKPSKKGNR